MQEMLRNCVHQKQLQFWAVLMDSGYATKEIMLAIETYQKTYYYCPLKDNRQVDDSGGSQAYRRVDALEWTERSFEQTWCVKRKTVNSLTCTAIPPSTFILSSRSRERPPCGNLPCAAGRLANKIETVDQTARFCIRSESGRFWYHVSRIKPATAVVNSPVMTGKSRIRFTPGFNWILPRRPPAVKKTKKWLLAPLDIRMGE